MAEAIELIGQLLDGWTERIEYRVTAQLHTSQCTAWMTYLSFNELRHYQCDCPTTVETRVERRRQGPLLTQLVEAGYRVPQNGSGSGGSGSTNKPEAKIPGNLVRPDEILSRCALVAADHCERWAVPRASGYSRDSRLATDLATLRIYVSGEVICRSPSSQRAYSGELVYVEASSRAPSSEEVDDLRHDLAKIVRQGRLFLGYDSDTEAIGDTVCGDCGGVLRVGKDMPSDVRCAGSPETPPCGKVYPWRTWASELARSGPRLVPTDAAVLASGIPRGSLYRLRSEGRLTKYGGVGKGRALWDIAEVLAYGS